MRCVLCFLTGEAVRGATMPEIAVVGGYSLCNGHLTDWAASGVPSVTEFINDKAVAWRTQKAAEVKTPAPVEVFTQSGDGREPMSDFIGDKLPKFERKRRGRPPKVESERKVE